jgi:hypothetical protein
MPGIDSALSKRDLVAVDLVDSLLAVSLHIVVLPVSCVSVCVAGLLGLVILPLQLQYPD